jgi:hypothetical protein
MKDPVAQLDTLRHEFDGLPFSALVLYSKCQVIHVGQRVWLFLSQHSQVADWFLVPLWSTRSEATSEVECNR